MVKKISRDDVISQQRLPLDICCCKCEKKADCYVRVQFGGLFTRNNATLPLCPEHYRMFVNGDMNL